jgi:hypothetical protein
MQIISHIIANAVDKFYQNPVIKGGIMFISVFTQACNKVDTCVTFKNKLPFYSC